MAIYFETEFNSFGGEFISIALVSDTGGELYAVRRLPDVVDPWVAENVVPFLLQEPEDDDLLRFRVANFHISHAGEPKHRRLAGRFHSHARLPPRQ